MDWGLFDSGSLAPNADNRFLREEIVYSSTVRLLSLFKLLVITSINLRFAFSLGLLLFRDCRRFRPTFRMGFLPLSD